MNYSEILINRPDIKDEMEEYAGKLEYSAGYTRSEAEDLTSKRMHEKYLIFSQGNLFHKPVDTIGDI